MEYTDILTSGKVLLNYLTFPLFNHTATNSVITLLREMRMNLEGDGCSRFQGYRFGILLSNVRYRKWDSKHVPAEHKCAKRYRCSNLQMKSYCL
jgi:hypothetical protein